MRKIQKPLRRALCLVLALLMLLPAALPAMAAGGKATKQRAIAVVFDNSGSMYEGDPDFRKAWCRATYAIEVFAAMMNDGDVLEIYPMNPIEVAGAVYTMEDPLVIDSQSKVPLIQQIYTPGAGRTHIESIYAAFEGLKDHQGKEQWLVVLTDGALFYENQGQNEIWDTEDRLTQVLSEYNNSVNVTYLGIGPAAEPTISGRYQNSVSVARNSASVLSELTAMCNMIFGRDSLPDSSANISFELAMNKLIVFVQGDGVADVKLSGSSGGQGSVIREYAPHYSETGAGNCPGFLVDKGLQGVILTYADCPAGSYSLSYSGNPTSIHYYYEPNVDLKAFLTDTNGNPINGEFSAGDYLIQYGMVDDKGNVTTSSLLGKTNYEITYYKNGTAETVTSDAAGAIPITVSAGDTLDVEAAVTYLSGYHIRHTGPEMGWPNGGYTVSTKPAGKLQLKATGGQEGYKLSKLEEAPPFQLTLSYEDAALSGQQLDGVKMEVRVEGGSMKYDLQRTDTGYTLAPRYNGNPNDTDCGEYTISITATYEQPDTMPATSNTVNLPLVITDDRFALSMDLQNPAGYLQISSIPNAQPLKAVLRKDGAPLTDEELKAITITVEAGNLPILVSMLPGESAYELRLDPAGSYEPGVHDIHCKATGTDSVGNPLEAQGQAKIEMQHYPQWLRWVIALAIIALIIFLVLTYRNAKILPAAIAVRSGSTTFTVDGSKVTGNAKVEFTGKNKRNGSLSVTMPKASSDPTVKGGFSMELVAVSPRKVKSAARRAGVISFTPVNGSSVHTIQAGNITYKKGSDGRFERVGGKKKAADNGKDVLFEIGNNANCVISGETVSGTSFSCTCKLQFN